MAGRGDAVNRQQVNETLRLFVAIELAEDVKQALTRTIDGLRAALHSEALRWARPAGMHLTLQFLGATPGERVPAITSALTTAARGVEPFDLSASGIESFGGRGRMSVVWLGIAEREHPLADLAARVRQSLRPLGFEADRQPFRAHFTLARVREDASKEERRRLHDILSSVPAPELPPFGVDKISLMQSTLARGGAVYAPVASFPLESGGGGAHA